MYDINIKTEASEQFQKVSDKEIKMIKKKIRYNKTRFSLVLFTAILIFVIIYSLFDDKGLLPICCLCLIFIFPVTKGELKKKVVYSCYGIVTEKETRYAEIHDRRFPPHYVSYESTESSEEIKQKQTSSHKVYYSEIYYCSLEVNGRKYDKVCCYEEDFANIKIGDKVIVSTIYDMGEVIIFAIK